MYLLTIILLMSSGAHQPVFLLEPDKYVCAVDAQRALSLNKAGVPVLVASCSRPKAA